MMNMEDSDRKTMRPASLPGELRTRLLAAMRRESCRTDDWSADERILRRLHPVPVPKSTAAAVRSDMYRETARCYRRRVAWAAYRMLGGAAAVLLLCVAGWAMMNAGESPAVSSGVGLVARSVVDARVSDTVRWTEDDQPVLTCDVLYEDSFVMGDVGNSTIVVRVPNRTRVEMQEDMI